MILPESSLSNPEPSTNRTQSASSTSLSANALLAVGDAAVRRAKGKPYSGWTLRAYPPPRGELAGSAAPIKMRKGCKLALG
jgi:hypothetical protein